MTYPLTVDPISAVQTIYPYTKIDQVFDNQELENVIEYFESQGVDDASVAGIGKESGNFNKKARSSQTKFHHPNKDNAWIFERLCSAIEQLNASLFRFDLVGFNSLQYTKYANAGDHYDLHTDLWYGNWGIQDSLLHRKLSFSLVLSDSNEYTGGNFEFMVSSPVPHVLEQSKGDLIVFPSWVLHRVTPIESGERKSLVGWVEGPKFK
jgi:PKHD-type hydroxylase